MHSLGVFNAFRPLYLSLVHTSKACMSSSKTRAILFDHFLCSGCPRSGGFRSYKSVLVPKLDKLIIENIDHYRVTPFAVTSASDSFEMKLYDSHKRSQIFASGNNDEDHKITKKSNIEIPEYLIYALIKAEKEFKQNLHELDRNSKGKNVVDLTESIRLRETVSKLGKDLLNQFK